MRILMVDWENLTRGLGAWGVSWSPQRQLQTLVETLEARIGAIDSVELHCPGHVETKADRRILQRPGEGRRVIFELCAPGKNMADIQIAVKASEAFHAGHAVAIVSDDRDLGYVVRYHALKGRASTLVHLEAKPPTTVKGLAGCSIPLPPAFRPKTKKRKLRSWDLAALSLYALGSPSSPLGTATGLIEAPSTRWWEDQARGEFGRIAATIPADLEQADSVVARLWRLRWGGGLDRAEAERVAATRIAGGVDPGEVIDALLAARLLRVAAGDRCEVAPSWRDGLVVPMRRVVLFLALSDERRATATEIQNLLRRSVARIHVNGIDEDEAAHIGAVHLAAVADLQQYVLHALKTRIKAIADQPQQRGGSVVTLTDRRHPFVQQSIRVATEVVRVADRPVIHHVLARRLGEFGVVDPDRWVRCLLDARVLTRHGDRYSATPGASERLSSQSG